MNIALILILSIAYLAGTAVFWKNIPLTGGRRTFFSLSIIPVFLLAMFFNIWLTEHLFPSLMNAFADERQQNAAMLAEGIRVKRSSEGLLAFVVSAPIALIISYLWYTLFRSMERANEKEEMRKKRLRSRIGPK